MYIVGIGRISKAEYRILQDIRPTGYPDFLEPDIRPDIPIRLMPDIGFCRISGRPDIWLFLEPDIHLDIRYSDDFGIGLL